MRFWRRCSVYRPTSTRLYIHQKPPRCTHNKGVDNLSPALTPETVLRTQLNTLSFSFPTTQLSDKKYHNYYDNSVKNSIFAEKNEAMRVLMNRDLLDLYESGRSKEYKDVARNRELMEGFRRAVRMMTLVTTVAELGAFSYLHYEQLKYQWSGFSSVRLSNRHVHRLIFKETDNGLQVELIDIDDTHYGNKR